MSRLNLSLKVHSKLQQLFSPELQTAAVTLLETQCGLRLPMIDAKDTAEIERIQCAAMKLSDGSLEKLKSFVHLANQDWQDVLVAAGFAEDTNAHIAWLACNQRS